MYLSRLFPGRNWSIQYQFRKRILDYRILSYPVAFNFFGSCFTVVATQDGTNLTIFNSQTNSTSNVTINMGQEFRYRPVSRKRNKWGYFQDISGH
jgi:hypothetical protein